MDPFDFQLRTRIVCGPDRIDSLGALAEEMGVRRALVASDAGVIAAGHTQRGIESLQAAGIEATLFDQVEENPTTRTVEAGLELARSHEPDLIVGLGGGSSMDCAKGINFLYTNGGRMQDYWGVGKATKPMLPMIAVPTTSGTGSETQSFALISDAQTHVKMACGDKKASFRIALLDPHLTLTQPARVTALTGIDAVAHALETFVTTKRSPVSLAFSREAWRLLATNLPRVLDEPDDVEARAGMQLGACWAGVAIENSMLGAAHALANPLTQQFGVVHGEAVGVMLPHVIRYNAAKVGPLYAQLLDDASRGNGSSHTPHDGAGLADLVARLMEKSRLALRLADLDVDRNALETLATEAAKQWTGTFNPRSMDAEGFHSLYEAAF